MTGSGLAVIVVPIVAFLALGIWLSAVMYAARNPGGTDRGERPRWNVTGGTFRGDPRQQTPHRDAEPPEAVAYQGSEQERRRLPRPGGSQWPRCPAAALPAMVRSLTKSA
jgi:hypothetical protein